MANWEEAKKKNFCINSICGKHCKKGYINLELGVMQHPGAQASKQRITFLTGHLSFHSPAVTLTNWRTLLRSPVHRTAPVSYFIFVFYYFGITVKKKCNFVVALFCYNFSLVTFFSFVSIKKRKGCRKLQRQQEESKIKFNLLCQHLPIILLVDNCLNSPFCFFSVYFNPFALKIFAQICVWCALIKTKQTLKTVTFRIVFLKCLST